MYVVVDTSINIYLFICLLFLFFTRKVHNMSFNMFVYRCCQPESLCVQNTTCSGNGGKTAFFFFLSYIYMWNPLHFWILDMKHLTRYASCH